MSGNLLAAAVAVGVIGMLVLTGIALGLTLEGFMQVLARWE